MILMIEMNNDCDDDDDDDDHYDSLSIYHPSSSTSLR